MNPNRLNPRHITIKMAKVKREDSKGSEKKHSVTRESLLGCQLIFLQKLCRPEGSGTYSKIYSKF